jgi:hypothetical protein
VNKVWIGILLLPVALRLFGQTAASPPYPPPAPSTTPATNPPAPTGTVQIKTGAVTITCDSTGKCTTSTEKVQPGTPAPATPSNWFGVGAVTSGSGSPAINMIGIYARRISEQNGLGLWSYSQYAVTSMKLRPFGIQTTVETGFAKDQWQFGRCAVFIFVAAGLSQTSTNTGYSASGGGFLHCQVWPDRPWSIVVAAQPLKTSLSPMQNIYAVAFGRIWP